MSLPKSAVRCSECSSFQNRRRWVPASQVTLALILSLLSVGSAVIPPIYRVFANRSETHVRVIGTEPWSADDKEPEPAIVVLVANNGKRPSLVKSATLKFSQSKKNAIHATDAELVVLNFKEVLIMPDAPVKLYLAGPMIGTLRKKGKKAVMDEVRAGTTATLIVTVEETNWRGKPFDAFPPHTFKTDKIEKWMEERVSSQ